MTAPERDVTSPTSAVADVGAPYDRRSSQRELGTQHEPGPFDPASVTFDPGVYLVEASAGTGKTFSLTMTVLRLLLDRTPSGEPRVRGIGNVLVVTFTNAATSELVTRVRRALRDAVDVFSGVVPRTEENAVLFTLRDQHPDGLPRLRQALSEIDQLSIFTIHGFCKRVLDESALESGTPYDAGFIEDDTLWIERVTQDWWRRTVYESDALAALVVGNAWRHDAFTDDLGQSQRWPNTRIEPDETLGDALAAFEAARRAFAAVWKPEAARAFLDGLKWRSNAPLLTEAGRNRVVSAGDALARGELLAGMAIVRECTTAAIRNDKTGIKVNPKPQFEQVPNEPFVQACDALAAATDRVHSALRVSCLREVAAQFDAEKRRRHLLDFDDLLRRLRDALDAEGEHGQLAQAIRRHYDAALIDEFQDTDPYQFPIFSKAFAKRPLFLIGDPKQAIYAFRGADIFAYREAVCGADGVYTLGRNWRSTPRMVHAVNTLFGRRPTAFLYDWIDFRPVEAAREDTDPLAGDRYAALHWWFAESGGEGGSEKLGKGETEQRFHRAVARECVRLLRPHDVGGVALEPRQIAVLVRTSREGLAVQAELRDANVPCIVAGLDDVLASREMRELERFLAAVLAPQNGRAVRAALATEMWGKNASDIHRLTRAEHEQEWQALVEELTELRETWIQRGFLRAVQRFIVAHGVTERLLAHDDGERRLTNLRQAVELLHALSVEERLSPEGLLLRIARARAMCTEKAERTELRLESDAAAVQIVTIHKSKGLEYDVVFCPGLWMCRRTAADAPVLVHEGDDVVFDHGSPRREERGRIAEADRLAEDLRLLYVALTRARYRCYVAWAPAENKGTRAGAWHTALAYLLRPEGIEGEPADVAAQVADVMKQEIAGWRTTLDELVASSGGAMSLEIVDADITDAPVERWNQDAAAGAAPTPRGPLPAGAQLDTWRIASFTSLTAAHHSGMQHVEDPRDVTDPGIERGARDGALTPVRARDDFLAFPAGRVAGIVLHELFEKVDFAASPDDVRTLTQEILLRERMADSENDGRIAAVAGMATRVLAAQLPGAHFALRDVPRATTLREWDFHLPLGTVERDTLARIFETRGGDLARRYAPALRRIGADRTHGFLTGVIDLAFVHEGRWYVADWKSNHLGDDPAQYEPAALEDEMFSSHYVLQYHLYVTALHRYLRARIPDYTYETHMGGVWYAFLRGIDGTDRGWFADRPPRALIEALDALMDAGRVAAVQERVA